jgi:class I fructose-bisphosphate aldolase
MYPRGAAVADDDSPEITAYAARVGLELGADIVKIKYSGSTEAFRRAVEAAGRTRVVLSGGAKTEKPEDFYTVVRSVIDAGASGVAVGRNVWQAEDPLAVTEQLKKIVFT